jgi:N-acetylglutamate synthase-like GNAT family acetyltransferase
MQVERNGYTIDDDKTRLDVDVLHNFIAASYWAEGIPRTTLERSIIGADCFDVYHGREQVGFARVMSDHATFAYLADVFVLPDHRAKGLAHWLVQTILAQPQYQGLRRWMLATRDAHRLYAKFGFTPVDESRLMEMRDSNANRT